MKRSGPSPSNEIIKSSSKEKEIDNLFIRIKERADELNNGKTDLSSELFHFITLGDLKELYEDILENESILKDTLKIKVNEKNKMNKKSIPFIENNVIESVRHSEKHLKRTLNIVRDPSSGEFALILETKHNLANGSKDYKTIPTFNGTSKKGAPAWRIDAKYPQKWINLVVRESYRSQDPLSLDEAKNEIGIIQEEVKMAKKLNKKGADIVQALGHPLFQSYSLGESFSKPYGLTLKNFKQSMYSPFAISTLFNVKIPLSVKDKNDITLSLLKALEVLHKKVSEEKLQTLDNEKLKAMYQNGTIHQDIKSENILLHENKNGYYAVLADFGVANEDVSLASYYCESPEISLAHSSPDDNYYSYYHEKYPLPSYAKYLANKTHSQYSLEDLETFKKPDPKNDMWAMGIVLYKFYVGGTSIDSSLNPTEVERNLKKYPLLKGLLDPNRESRFTAEEAVNHFENGGPDYKFKM